MADSFENGPNRFQGSGFCPLTRWARHLLLRTRQLPSGGCMWQSRMF
jgi:hypothetical protein